MTRWQVLKDHYKTDPIGFVILCWVFGSATAMAGTMVYIGWTTNNVVPLAIGMAVTATIVWVLHIVTAKRF